MPFAAAKQMLSRKMHRHAQKWPCSIPPFRSPARRRGVPPAREHFPAVNESIGMIGWGVASTESADMDRQAIRIRVSPSRFDGGPPDRNMLNSSGVPKRTVPL